MRSLLSAGLLSLLLPLLPQNAFGQAPPASPSTPPTATAGKTADADYAKEPYVFELLERKIRYEADGKGQHDVKFRVRVQSESAVREFGLLVYPFSASFENLDIIYARVRKPDGTTVETPLSDIQELDS